MPQYLYDPINAKYICNDLCEPERLETPSCSVKRQYETPLEPDQWDKHTAVSAANMLSPLASVEDDKVKLSLCLSN
jgi:hypothetical protein